MSILKETGFFCGEILQLWNFRQPLPARKRHNTKNEDSPSYFFELVANRRHNCIPKQAVF